MTWAKFKALWQEIDCRVAAGEYTPEQAVEAARQRGLIASTSPYLPHEVRDVLAFTPERYLAYRPWLLVVFAGDDAPRIYRPHMEPPLPR